MPFSFTRPKYINKPFKNLPLKKRAVFILHLAGFTYREIMALKIVASPSTVSHWLKEANENYER